MLSGRADPAMVAEATRIGVSGVLRKEQNADHIAVALDVIASGGVVFRPGKAPQAPAQGMRRYHPARDFILRDKRGPAQDGGRPEHETDVQGDGCRIEHPAHLREQHAREARRVSPARGRRPGQPREPARRPDGLVHGETWLPPAETSHGSAQASKSATKLS
jgi:hypothetical protein